MIRCTSFVLFLVLPILALLPILASTLSKIEIAVAQDGARVSVKDEILLAQRQCDPNYDTSCPRY